MDLKIVKITSFEKGPLCRYYKASGFQFVQPPQTGKIYDRTSTLTDHDPDFVHILLGKTFPVVRVELLPERLTVCIASRSEWKGEFYEDDPWPRIEGRTFFDVYLTLNNTPAERLAGQCWRRPEIYELRITRPHEQENSVVEEVLALCDDLAKIGAGAGSLPDRQRMSEGLERARWHLDRLITATENYGRPFFKPWVLRDELGEIATIMKRLPEDPLQDSFSQIEPLCRIRQIAYRNEVLLSAILDIFGKMSLSVHTSLGYRSWPM